VNSPTSKSKALQSFGGKIIAKTSSLPAPGKGEASIPGSCWHDS